MDSTKEKDLEDLLWLKAVHAEIGLIYPAREYDLEKKLGERLMHPAVVERAEELKATAIRLKTALEAAAKAQLERDAADRKQTLEEWIAQGDEKVRVMRELEVVCKKDLDEMRKRIQKVRAWEKRRLLVVLLSAAASIGLALLLFHLIVKLYAASPSSQLMVTYDIGALTQSLLVGVAALIAAFTYASRASSSGGTQS